MDTVNDRMQAITDLMFGGNKAAFAKAIGIAPTSITNYLGKQRASKPSADLLEKIVNSLDVDAMWLLTGKGEMRRMSIDEAAVIEIESLKEENVSLKKELERLKTLKLPTKDSKVYNLWMKFMDVTSEMQELYKEEKEG